MWQEERFRPQSCEEGGKRNRMESNPYELLNNEQRRPPCCLLPFPVFFTSRKIFLMALPDSCMHPECIITPPDASLCTCGRDPADERGCGCSLLFAGNSISHWHPSQQSHFTMPGMQTGGRKQHANEQRARIRSSNKPGVTYLVIHSMRSGRKFTPMYLPSESVERRIAK